MDSRTDRAGARKYLQISDLRRLRNLQFAAKLIVEGFYQGKHQSPFHDFSAEFADYRPYTDGDEVRSIDWRAFARTDRYYIKLFRKETDMNCYLLVDTSNSMGYRDQTGVSKLEYSSYLAAALAYLITRQGDKAGLALGGKRLDSIVPAGRTMQNLQRILISLERAEPDGPTCLEATIKSLYGAIRHRGLLIVVSDFLDDTEAVFKTLSMFTHKGFSVLLIQVMTDDELDLPDVESAIFKDMESDLFAVSEPAAIRTAYQAEVQAFLHSVESNARARKMSYLLAKTSTQYHSALEQYLTVRNRS